MKKVRIMLMALGALVVVSGALAFKANKFVNKKVFCATAAVTSGACTQGTGAVTYQTATTTDANRGTIASNLYCTTVETGTCPNVVIVYTAANDN